jgi:hypothetical protein
MSGENISLPVAQALASALEKIEAYVPTEYVDNSEPDIDAEHLNHAEQGIMRVTNLLNAAVDVIQGQESRLEDTETKVGTAALTGGMTDLSSGVNSLYSNLNNRISVSEKFTSGELLSIIKQMSDGIHMALVDKKVSGIPFSNTENYIIVFKGTSYGDPYTRIMAFAMAEHSIPKWGMVFWNSSKIVWD